LTGANSRGAVPKEHIVSESTSVTAVTPDPSAWYASTPSEGTLKQEDAKEQARAKRAAESASKPKRERKPRKQAAAPAAPPAPTLPTADKGGWARCKPGQSAPKTRNGYMPDKSSGHYAKQAREHIRKLRANAKGRAMCDDIQALTAELVANAGIPADYAHRNHVSYWVKQVLGVIKCPANG
jgi:hypothetical protein